MYSSFKYMALFLFWQQTSFSLLTCFFNSSLLCLYIKCKKDLNIKFRRKLVLGEMVQSLYGYYVGRSALFQRKWWDPSQISQSRMHIQCRVPPRPSIILPISGFASWWLHSLASLGFVMSPWEVGSRRVAARMIAEWRSERSLQKSFDKVTLPNSQQQFCSALGEVRGSGFQISKEEDIFSCRLVWRESEILPCSGKRGKIPSCCWQRALTAHCQCPPYRWQRHWPWLDLIH